MRGGMEMEEAGAAAPKGCSVATTVVLVVVVSAVAAAIVGLAVGFGLKSDSSEGAVTVPNTTLAPSTTLAPPSGQEVLLPTALVPLHYDVRIRPVFSDDAPPTTFRFNGSVTIRLRVTSPTDVITLHANHLDIVEASIHVVTSPGGVVNVRSATYDARLQFYVIQLEAELGAGTEVSVTMEFSGPISNDLVGIYYSSYKPDENSTRYLLASQMQPTDARKVFPCMDEPALKATFNVTIERRTSMKTLSNTVIYRTDTLDGQWVADYYKSTPRMSTYLLAFVVSDFECVQSNTTSGKPVLVCARPNAIDQAEYASSIAARIQDFYEVFYNITYPMEQTVHVAVPDFAAGAMENWGCIIYRETALLYDPLASTAANKQRVAVVIGHELAHMWFGDIVTPAWWDDIWLNEGFASYMEYKGVNSVEPDWDMDAQFLPEDLQRVLQTDALLTSHPIYQEVAHPDQINELFDSITYSKGASVIRMMYYFLGEDVFQAGITRYLNENQYDVTHHTELFNVLTQTSASMRPTGQGVNVTRVMFTWILQMGYPVVNMSYNSTTGQVTLRQERFLTFKPTDSSAILPSEFNYQWVIPVSVASDLQDFDSAPTHWLDTETGTLDSTAGAQWIVGNPLQRYYYRVNYDDVMWTALIGQLMTDHTVIPSASRAQLIDDAFSMARPGLVSQVKALEVSRYLANETEFVPWTAAGRSFSYIRRMLATGASLDLLRTYMQRQLQRVYDEVGWTDEATDSHLTRLLRVQVVDMACIYNHADCLHQAALLFPLLFNSSTAQQVDVNLRGVTYCHGIAAGGVAEWGRAFERYRTSNLATEQAMILSALGCTRDAFLLADYLRMALAEVQLRRQDFATVVVAVARNRNGQQLAWDFMRLNWNVIYQRFSLFSLSNIVAGVTESFSTQEHLDELKAFVAANSGSLGAAERTTKQAVESTEANIAWRRANEQSVTTWLQQQ